jgi:tetratricopeptide (TPR) repeat protein
MTRDKIQYAFMILVGLVLLAAMASVGIYFWQSHQKWQGYRNDPDKSKLVSQIDAFDAKKDKTGDDYLQLGNSYHQLGEDSLAIGAYKRAIDTPSKDVAELNLASAYTANKEYKKAESQYYTILKEKNYGDSSIYLKLYDLYKIDWQGKVTDSLGILLEGLVKIPNSEDLLSNLGEYYENAGDKKQAIDYYNKVLAIDPKNEAVKQTIERLQK